jgi:lysyl-tRNA synthetase class 2
MKSSGPINRRKNLQLRMQLIQTIRIFFNARGYLEIDTPIRIPAPAPEAHVDPEVSGSWFLQTSPELCMKQLLAAGFPEIFQICKCFRSKERGRRHLPELTMLEWYTVGRNYMDMMAQCEQLIQFILNELDYGQSVVYQGAKIDFQTPWTRLSVTEAFEKYASMPLKAALLRNCFDEVMIEEIEPHLGLNPVFLYDYPAALGALAKLKSKDSTLAERFELYVGGLELCNAFSELTDPIEQRKRFEAQRRLRQRMGKPAYPMPENFLNSLKTMPEAAGNALGIDRLVMLFVDTSIIDDVVAFTPEEV